MHTIPALRFLPVRLQFQSFRKAFHASIFILVAACPGSVYGQLDSMMAYCNLFYATTDQPDIIPFEDNCFVNFNYEIKDYPTVRVVGPIGSQVDLFKEYNWSVKFHFPEMTGRGILTIEIPKDISQENLVMPAGKMFVSLSDNRERRYYGPNSHKIDYIAVEGKVKINEYAPAQPGWAHPELQAQLDVYLQQVVDGGQGPKPTGPKIRFKCVLVVENKKE